MKFLVIATTAFLITVGIFVFGTLVYTTLSLLASGSMVWGLSELAFTIFLAIFVIGCVCES